MNESPTDAPKVSLLSREIATARGQPGMCALQRAADAPHQQQSGADAFMRQLQQRRAEQVSDLLAAVKGHSPLSGDATGARARSRSPVGHKQQQQQPQQQQQQPPPPTQHVVVRVEEGSPPTRRLGFWGTAPREPAQPANVQQVVRVVPLHQQPLQQQQQQQPPPQSPQSRQSQEQQQQSEQEQPPPQEQQQQLPPRQPPPQLLPQQQQQQQQQPQRRGSASLPPLPPTSLRRQALLQPLLVGGQQADTLRGSDACAVPPAGSCSAGSSMLLDTALSSADGAGWSSHYISGCAGVTVQQQEGDLAPMPSAAAIEQQQQQQQQALDAALARQPQPLLQRSVLQAPAVPHLGAREYGDDRDGGAGGGHPPHVGPQEEPPPPPPGWAALPVAPLGGPLAFPSACADGSSAAATLEVCGGTALSLGQLPGLGGDLAALERVLRGGGCSGSRGGGAPAAAVATGGSNMLATPCGNQVGMGGGGGGGLPSAFGGCLLGTPPLPPRGSRFDDMDSFSSSGPLLASMPERLPARPRPGAGLRALSAPAVAAGSAAGGPAHMLHEHLLDAASPAAAGANAAASLLPLSGAAAWGLRPGPLGCAGVVGEQLESLLAGLALLGQRSAEDAGAELALARSVHSLLRQHQTNWDGGGGGGGSGGGAGAGGAAARGARPAAVLLGQQPVADLVGSRSSSRGVDAGSSNDGDDSGSGGRGGTGAAVAAVLRLVHCIGHAGGLAARAAAAAVRHLSSGGPSEPVVVVSPAAAAASGSSRAKASTSSPAAVAQQASGGQQQQQQGLPLGQAVRRWR
jgi:hypothetical protein